MILICDYKIISNCWFFFFRLKLSSILEPTNCIYVKLNIKTIRSQKFQTALNSLKTAGMFWKSWNYELNGKKLTHRP